jgi:thiosulfate/3-mercaptopyruvate sulfurtransferase
MTKPLVPVSPVSGVSDLLTLLSSDEEVVVVDCRFNLADVTLGKREYATGHLPSAVYADLEQDLSGTIVRGETGRHPLPEATKFATFLGNQGIDNNTHVVAYDDGSCMFAPRLWWLLRWSGHSRVSVLRGGLKAWLASGGAIEQSPVVVQPKVFTSTLNPDMLATLDVIETHVAQRQSAICLLDARAEPRFRGAQEPIDPVAGHIPSARNLPFGSLLDAGGPKSSAEVRSLLNAAIAPYTAKDAVAYCGSGVTACALIWAAECAGIEGIRLYPGSWSEWITSATRPVARD